MKVTIRLEAGYDLAMEGLSYNKNADIARMPVLASKLMTLGSGHDKFLRQIAVWLEITAPRYFWAEMDTYKIGTTAQSQSTMNTIMKRELTKEDFAEGTPPAAILLVNDCIRAKDFLKVKKCLPEGLLQKRMWTGNYAVLSNIVRQRSNHRLDEWIYFVKYLQDNLQHPELIWGQN